MKTKYTGFARERWAVGVLALALTACASRAPEPAPEPPPPPPPQAAETEPAPEPAKIEMRVRTPYKYVVKKGDTLWGIARHFMKDAWQWPEVWVVNPRVENPHLIYPGDVLYLIWKDGRPQVGRSDVVDRGVERISPQIREIPLDQAVPAIPIDAIREFLRGPRLITKQELDRAPYVVEFAGEHLIAGSKTDIYAANVPRDNGYVWQVVHLGERYVDPDTGETLGYEAIPAADAEVRDYGAQVTTLNLVAADREVRIADRLMPVLAEEFDANFFPHAPSGPVGARIISVFDGVSQIGQYQIVALNRGSTHGLEPGHVLDIQQAGRLVDDPMGSGQIRLPDQHAGQLMVFKTHPRLSYGLVMRATRAIHIFDRAEKPSAR